MITLFMALFAFSSSYSQGFAVAKGNVHTINAANINNVGSTIVELLPVQRANNRPFRFARKTDPTVPTTYYIMSIEIV